LRVDGRAGLERLRFAAPREVFLLSFDSLGLDARLLQAISACGFSDPTAIQREAIPRALAGCDLMASAQTGTGKTAAFVLPALHKLLNEAPLPGRGPRVLVLTPTRELAQQVTEAIRRFGASLRLRSGSVVGGEAYGPQLKMLGAPLDLLVATPGRLIDHLDRGRLDLGRVGLLVLDEADRMLDMGFIDDVQRIADACPRNRQTLLFSATLEGRIGAVAARILKDPEEIRIAGVREKHENIEQRLHLADDVAHKHALLTHLLAQPELSQCVVFTATKRGAEALAERLQDKGETAAALHGDMPQRHRERTVVRMRRGQVRVLVATDVAARGLDIPGLSHVINFELPMQAEDYVHRIGRTGRGGESGVAVSLVGPQERVMLSRIERLTGHRLDDLVIEGLEPRLPASRSAPAGTRGKGNGRGGPGRPRGQGGGMRRETASSWPARSGEARPASTDGQGRPAAQRQERGGPSSARSGQQAHDRRPAWSDGAPRRERVSDVDAQAASEAKRLLDGFHERVGRPVRPATAERPEPVARERFAAEPRRTGRPAERPARPGAQRRPGGFDSRRRDRSGS
jgi:superfamily II DNA/RNA helicase